MSELPGTASFLGSLVEAAVPSATQVIDHAQLAPLIGDLKRDLDALEAGDLSGVDVDRLRAEVAQLWAALENGELTSAGLPERLANLHGMLDHTAPAAEGEVGAFKAAGYFTAIGRMIGLD